MLKISLLESGKHCVTLHLEGRAVGPWVTELRQACEAALDEGRPLTLQLGEVDFLDPKAVALLAGLRARGVSLLGCSPFVSEQLKTGAAS